MANSKIVPESFNRPAGWAEMATAISSVMVAYCIGILLINKKMEFGAAAGAPIPVVVLPVLAWAGSGGAGFFLAALATRGSGTGKVMDCLSIASGLALLGFLIYYVIGGVACLLVAVGLFCVRKL